MKVRLSEAVNALNYIITYTFFCSIKYILFWLVNVPIASCFMGVYYVNMLPFLNHTAETLAVAHRYNNSTNLTKQEQ